MRHLPNDTITVTLSDGQFATVFGDPDFSLDARGGNDTIMATIVGHSLLTLVGDDTALQGHSHGGNDVLAMNVSGFEDTAILDGDAQSMSGHAKGGNDTLYADSFGALFSSMSLYGDAEGDVSDHAKGGNDHLVAQFGGRSFNTFGGDAGGSMTGNAHGGDDTLVVTQASQDGSAQLVGDAVMSMTGEARGGNDNLVFVAGANAELVGADLIGDAATMTDDARGGNDVLSVVVTGDPATVASRLDGDARNMSGSTHGGNDILNGSSHNDFLFGDAESYAPSAPGAITGGKDVLNGGAGNDQLWGGPNNDLFIFKIGSGQDVINDFDQGNLAVGSTAREHDVIDVHDYGFKNWATLSHLISDDGAGNAVVHLTANDTITLNGIHTAALHAGDFVV